MRGCGAERCKNDMTISGLPITLSIIVPCLNEAGGIASSLERLQPLRTRGIEVIVVDGNSNDGSLARAAPLADRTLTAPRGRASQMNTGAAFASGRTLLFLHADCELPSDADCLISDGMSASGRRWGRFDVRLAGTHPLLRIVARTMNWRSRLTGIATGDQGIFVERELFFAVGGFPAIPLMEDVALSGKLKRIAAPLCLKQRITASGRRWERYGVVRTILLMWQLRLAYFMGASPVGLALRYDGACSRD